MLHVAYLREMSLHVVSLRIVRSQTGTFVSSHVVSEDFAVKFSFEYGASD